MTTPELISSYSFVGDTITVITCFSLLVMIHFALYFSNEKNFQIFKTSVILIGAAAFSNVLFSFTCISDPNNIFCIILYRDIYHVLCLSDLFIYCIYTENLVDMPKTIYRKLTRLSAVAFGIGLLLDLLSPLTHFGFYYENGYWSDSTYIKPYTFVYMYALVFMAFVLIYYGDKMIKSVREVLVITELLCVIIILVENSLDSNTFTTFTFLIPGIVVLVLLHSMPYDQVTGAMNSDAYSKYLNHLSKKNKSCDYMILELSIDPLHELPFELGSALHTFWIKTFKVAALFNLHSNVYVLAIERNYLNKNTEEKIQGLIDNVFYRYYNTFHIDFKGITLIDASYIKTLNDMNAALSFFLRKCNNCEFIKPNEPELEEFARSRVIFSQLTDIHNSNNLNDDRVLVYCQPVKNVNEDCFDTAEILMRLYLPELGLVYPNQFIPIAEENGYIHTLSRIILNKACRQLKIFLDEGYKIERISINFAISELKLGNFNQEILDIIKANNVPYEKIAVEITESQTDDDFNILYKAVESLRKYGLKFYLDDFGTGYSNLERILHLNIDIIKFDRSLLIFADTEKNGEYTLRHFSEIFEGLDYKILFEGVETDDQEKLCIESYADYLQGYKFSKPIPFKAATDFFSKAE